MIYGSVCSGIEAATVAWHPLGWKCAFASEIEAFPRAVLQHRWKDIPLHGDFTTIQAGEYEPIDLLVGGTPCQSFSVAGLRGGLDDDRGNLALEYLRLADRLRPRWLVWENVPGVLSSAGGRDFGAILGGMVELGYGVAYRVLDAQFFGVAQRRRRVFVVGYLGDWRRAAAVLFERHSLSGNPAPRREAGQDVAGVLTSRASGGGGGPGAGTDEAAAGYLQAVPSTGHTAHCLNAGGMGRQDYETETLIAHTLKGEGFDASEDGTGRGTPLVAVQPFAIQERAVSENPNAGPDGAGFRSDGAAYTLEARTVPQAVAFTCSEQSNSYAWERPFAPTLNAQVPNDTSNIQTGVRIGSAVRRLTPTECERLQGFPEVENTLRILVCSEAEKHGFARSAEPGSAAQWPAPSAPVVVHARIDLERQRLQLSSPGRSLWSASIADGESSSHPSIPNADIARLAALMNSAVGRLTQAGRAASQPNTKLSSRALNGSAFALSSGQEIDALASDAARFTDALTECSRSITSQAGQPAPISDETLRTLASCVAAAMTGFIPRQTPSASSYEIRVTAHQGYTAIPWRGGAAPDGPRYKALGNSMAVPVMAWIGRRIEAVEALQVQARAA